MKCFFHPVLGALCLGSHRKKFNEKETEFDNIATELVQEDGWRQYSLGLYETAVCSQWVEEGGDCFQ